MKINHVWGSIMYNITLGQFLLLLAGTIAPREDISISSWLAVVFLLILAILLIVIIVYSVIHRSNKNRLTSEKDDRRRLGSKYKDLQKTNSDIMNENIQLESNNFELKESNEKLKKLAYYDNLTGLPNRISLKELLDSIMITIREDEKIGLLLINMDNFKDINSQLGNSYGDELLIDVTHRLKQVISDNDYLSRVGGDEFVIVTQNISNPDEYDERLRRIMNIFSYPFALSTEERFASVSIGVVIAPKDGDNTTTLLKNANVAMRNAKTRGKNTYVYFEETMNDVITKKIQIQSELRKSFEENEFILHYEPVISLKNNKIEGFETLVFWNHPEMGLIHPDEYLSLVEETGIISSIGLWAFKDIIDHIKNWKEEGYDNITISYNVSKLEFKDPEFVSTIWDIVGKADIDPHNLILEISETTILDNIDYTIKTINKLSELGIRFGLDKFGTNYSSIKYLSKLALDYVKIDKSLSKLAIQSINNQKTAEAIINLIKTFDVKIVAEGIDSQEQAVYLRRTDCDLGQGPLFSEAVTEEEVLNIINKGLKESRME